MAAKVKALAIFVFLFAQAVAVGSHKGSCADLGSALSDPSKTEQQRIEELIQEVRVYVPDADLPRSSLEAAVRAAAEFQPEGFQAQLDLLEEKEFALAERFLFSADPVKEVQPELEDHILKKTSLLVFQSIARRSADNIANDIYSFDKKMVKVYNNNRNDADKVKLINANLALKGEMRSKLRPELESKVRFMGQAVNFFKGCLGRNLFIVLSNSSIELYNRESQSGASAGALEVVSSNFDLTVAFGEDEMASNMLIIVENYIKLFLDKPQAVSEAQFRSFIAWVSQSALPFLQKTDTKRAHVLLALSAYTLGSLQGVQASSYMDFTAGYYRAKGLQGILAQEGELRSMLLFQFASSTYIADLNIEGETFDYAQLAGLADEILSIPAETIQRLRIYANFSLYRTLIKGDEAALNEFFVAFLHSLNRFLLSVDPSTPLGELHLQFGEYLNAHHSELKYGEYLLMKLYSAIFAANKFEIGAAEFVFVAESEGFAAGKSVAYLTFIDAEHGSINEQQWAKILKKGFATKADILLLVSMGGKVNTRTLNFINSEHKYNLKPFETYIFTQKEYEEKVLGPDGKVDLAKLDKFEKDLRELKPHLKVFVVQRDDGQIVDAKTQTELAKSDEFTEAEKEKPQGPIRKAANKSQDQEVGQDLSGDEEEGQSPREPLIGGPHNYISSTNNRPLLGAGDHDLNVAPNKFLLGADGHDLNVAPNKFLLGADGHDQEVGVWRKPILPPANVDQDEIIRTKPIVYPENSDDESLPQGLFGKLGPRIQDRFKNQLEKDGEIDLHTTGDLNVPAKLKEVINGLVLDTLKKKLPEIKGETELDKALGDALRELEGTPEFEKAKQDAIDQIKANGNGPEKVHLNLNTNLKVGGDKFINEIKTVVHHFIYECDIHTSTFEGSKDVENLYFDGADLESSNQIERDDFIKLMDWCRKNKNIIYGPGSEFYKNGSETESPAEIDEDASPVQEEEKVEEIDLNLTPLANVDPFVPQKSGKNFVVTTYHHISCKSSSSEEMSSNKAPEDGVYARFTKQEGDETITITVDEFYALEDKCDKEREESDERFANGFYKVTTHSLNLDRGCQKDTKVAIKAPAHPNGKKFEVYLIEESESQRVVSREEWKAAFNKCNADNIVSYKTSTLNEDCSQSVTTTSQDRRIVASTPENEFIAIKGGKKTQIASEEEYQVEVKNCLIARAKKLKESLIGKQGTAEFEKAAKELKELKEIPGVTEMEVAEEKVLTQKINSEDFGGEFDDGFDLGEFDKLAKNKLKVKKDDGQKLVIDGEERSEVEPVQSPYSKGGKHANKFTEDIENDLAGAEETDKPHEKDGLSKSTENKISRAIGKFLEEGNASWTGDLDNEVSHLPGQVRQPTLDDPRDSLSFSDSEFEQSPTRGNRIELGESEHTPVPEETVFDQAPKTSLTPQERLDKLLKGELSETDGQAVMADPEVLEIISRDPAQWLRRMYAVSVDCHDCFVTKFFA